MPTKVIHTAGFSVLFATPPRPEAIERALLGLQPSRAEASGPTTWRTPLFGLHVDLPTARARAHIAAFDCPWPDSMGDPKGDPELFAAWSLGMFGPFTFPGNLERAMVHAYEFPAARSLASAHHAFLRVSITQPSRDAGRAVIYDPLAELQAMTNLARALLDAPGALAYFNPGGEVLADAARIDATNREARAARVSSLPLWVNVRVAHFEQAPGWMIMDTIGMGQVDRDDLEAVFPSANAKCGQIAAMLRNAAEYVRERGPVIADGHTMDSAPGHRWVAKTRESGLMPGLVRQVLRWQPVGAQLPDAFA